MNGDQRLLAFLIVCLAVVLVAALLAAPGCNLEAAVNCKNGVSYSTSEWGGEPNFSAAEAESFCKDQGGQE